MHDQVAGVPIVAILVVGFAVLVGLLMSRTSFGQRSYALGTNESAARLFGVSRVRVLLGVYASSAVTAALAGILLTGYAGQSYLGMGDSYLLPSIAAVVIGGSSILGGRGHYAGTFAGAIFLTLLGSVTSATGLSDAMREVLFGLVILVAILACGTGPRTPERAAIDVRSLALALPQCHAHGQRDDRRGEQKYRNAEKRFASSQPANESDLHGPISPAEPHGRIERIKRGAGGIYSRSRCGLIVDFAGN